MTVELAFVPEPRDISVDAILPSRPLLGSSATSSLKSRQIKESIKEIGLIEPLSVVEIPEDNSHVLLLDGHMRLRVLRELGWTSVPCLFARDDESYTYNNRVSDLSNVQESRMIKAALERGVSPERLSRALDLRVDRIMRKSELLVAVSPRALAVFGERRFPDDVATHLREMIPTRQVECAKLLVASGRVTAQYAKALLLATPDRQLTTAKRRKRSHSAAKAEVISVRKELSNVEEQFKVAERSYGRDALDLSICEAYLAKLLKHAKVTRYLQRTAPDVLSNLRESVAA